MAISARFIADFSSFSTGVSKAEVELRGFEGNANKVQTSLNKIANSLSGTRLIQDARLMSEAVDRIGGVTKLTDRELQKLGAQAQEASEKMQRMGVGVPPNLQAIADAAKKIKPPVDTATSGLNSMISTIGKIGAAVGIGFGVGAIVSFGKALLSDADALVKMSDRTGASIEGLQRLQVAGDDAGNTIEQMTGAINQMQNRLAEGDASAVGALSKLNLSITELAGLSPDEQFIAISDALREIKNPADQVNIAMDLFGRSGAEVLPTLKRGFDDLKGAIVGMSEETVRKMDEAGDAIDRWWRKTKGNLAMALVAHVDYANAVLHLTTPAVAKLAEEEQRLMVSNRELREKVLANVAAIQAHQDALNGFIGPVMDVQMEMARSAKTQREQDEASRKAEATTNKLAEAHRSLLVSIRGLDNPLREQTFLLKDLAGLGVTVTVQEMTASFTAFTTVVKDVAAIEQSAINGTKKFTGALEELGVRVDSTADSFLSWKDATAFVGPTLEQAGKAAQSFGQTVRGAFDDIAGILDNISGKWAEFGAVVARTGSAIMSNLATGDVVGAVVSGVTGAISAIGKLFGDSTQREVNKTRQAFVDAAGGLHELNLAAHEAGMTLDAFLDARNPEQYTKAIDDLNAAIDHHADLVSRAGQFGFSQTQKEQAIADAAEVLQYMQDAGGYTAEAIEKAYAAWQKAMADAGNEAAQAWVKAHDAATTAVSATGKALDDLVSKRDGLMAGIAGEAPEEVMGVIEAQTRGQIAALDSQIEAQRRKLEAEAQDVATALEEALSRIDPKPVHVPILWDIPALPGVAPWEAPELPGFAKGTQGKYLDFGSGTPVTLHGKERVMTEGESGGGDVHVHFNGTVVGGRRAADELAGMVTDALDQKLRRARVGRAA